MSRIGLVAGHGKLPMLFARAAKEKGETVIAFGLKGITHEDLAGYVDKIHWLEWGNLQKALLLLATERIKKIVMLGKIEKNILFKGDEKLDDQARSMLQRIGDRKDYPILKEVAGILGKLGIEVIDSTTYLKDLIPSKGVLTKREPTKEEWEDIAYGKLVARELSRFDIGQTLAVKNKTVIALEAVEGTDETIRRSGSLASVGFSVIKVARPDQDMRFDVPLIGPDTLKTLIEANGKVLALEEGKTFLMDKEEMIKLADEKGVSIVVI
jgi:UDP-2,3-diacylglucosamine hydrolase